MTSESNAIVYGGNNTDGSASSSPVRLNGCTTAPPRGIQGTANNVTCVTQQEVEWFDAVSSKRCC